MIKANTVTYAAMPNSGFINNAIAEAVPAANIHHHVVEAAEFRMSQRNVQPARHPYTAAKE
jgi:hypothetical protein